MYKFPKKRGRLHWLVWNLRWHGTYMESGIHIKHHHMDEDIHSSHLGRIYSYT